MTYVIAQPCADIKDRACVAERPVEGVHGGERTRRIEDDVPRHWAPYTFVNAEYVELVARLPPQTSDKKDIVVSALRKEEAADVDRRFPS